MFQFSSRSNDHQKTCWMVDERVGTNVSPIKPNSDNIRQDAGHTEVSSLRWRHNDVSNHRPLYCLPNRFFRCWSKKASKLRVTGLCEGNSPVTGEFPAQMASYAENISMWWRHLAKIWFHIPKSRALVLNYFHSASIDGHGPFITLA